MRKPDFAKEVDLTAGWFEVEQAYVEARAAGCEYAEARGWPSDPEHLTVYGFIEKPE